MTVIKKTGSVGKDHLASTSRIKRKYWGVCASWRGGKSAEDAGQKLTDPVWQDVQRCVKLNAAVEIQKRKSFSLNTKF